MLYYTEYKHGESVYCQVLIADDEQAAQGLIAKRNIGEVIVGFPVSNAPIIFTPDSPEHLYQELAFTAWIHMKSGAGVDEVLGPGGWFTEYLCSRYSPLEPVLPKANELLVRTNEIRSSLGLPRFKRLTP